MKILRAGRPLGLAPRGTRSKLLEPLEVPHLRSTTRVPRRQTPNSHPSTSASSAVVVVAASASSSSSAANETLSLARKLQGTWIADYNRSSGRAKLLSALGLSGLQRVTAEKLIEGVELKVVEGAAPPMPASSSSLSSSSSSFVAEFLTVVPFFEVREAVPLDGSTVTLPRRDLKPGGATVSLLAERSERGGAPSPPRLVVVSEWKAGEGASDSDGKRSWPFLSPAPGSKDKDPASTLCLRETYKLIKPTELHVEASLFERGGGERGGAGSAAAVASSVTVYRLSKEWKPRYSFPSSSSSSPSSPSSSEPRDRSSSPPSVTRRSLAISSALLSVGVSPFLEPRPSGAALPPGLISPSPTSETPSPIPRSAPLPPTFPRKRLALPLAVLLLRSCYDAVDDADVVAMDAFQKDFFKVRASSWEPYLDLLKRAASKSKKQYERPTQGELSDPVYFDVIAFAQAVTIDAEFKKCEEAAFIARAEASPTSSAPSSESERPFFEYTPTFDEYCEAGVDEGCPESGIREVARSSPLLLPGFASGADADAVDVVASLWSRQRASAGDLAYSRMASGPFRGVDFSPPAPPGAFVEGEVLKASEELARVFVDGGFALGQSVSCTRDELEPRSLVISMRLDGPADLWCTSALAESSARSRGARRPPPPAFAGLALGGMLRASSALSVGDEPISARVVGGGTATEVSWRVFPSSSGRGGGA